ncbi:hypothetical protein [Acinetobacter proteolyticus]|uniref:Uncharacterized protein n=1 Tax=Acinetobacter proteolyticus TaxID=1776741 RepID=A0A2N0W9Z8_9GAMM|nr:hypothetical protein [Acinetobacter proteolyticus]PKF31322.1 hypothetical protein CW311_19455 [Acinetobacter proteolyticus]
MTERVVKVYPKQKELEGVVELLLTVRRDLMTYRHLDDTSRQELVSGLVDQMDSKIKQIKSLYESKA